MAGDDAGDSSNASVCCFRYSKFASMFSHPPNASRERFLGKERNSRDKTLGEREVLVRIN